MDEEKVFKSLTLKDKTKLFVGKNFWEIEPINNKSVFLSDGPHGIRKEEFDQNNKPHVVSAICYPAACLSACSFNKDLFKEYGQTLAKECIKNNVDVLLGPGINIKRNPLCGRNFEYFSEDPYLAGELAANYINGLQSKNVGSCLKHLALNSRELARFVNDSIADERTIREIYLKGFEIAIKKSHPWAIMASYNKLNGIHTTENKWLLTDIVRNEFGFDGIFMSDWGAMLSPLKSIEAGLDLEMPGVSKGSETIIKDAVLNHKIDENIVNESCKRLINLCNKSSQEKVNDFDLNNALDVAKKINDESIILLKNEDNILPLKNMTNLALIGDLLRNPRIQGGGSSQINAINVTNLYDEFLKENIKFKYEPGYHIEDIKPNKDLISKAVEIAKNASNVILMLGLPRVIESEGYDRENMKLPDSQLLLLDELYKVNKNIIVLLQNGSAIEMPFINKIKGLLECYFGGSMNACSIKDILLGKVNPSGRLAESFPISYKDVVSSKYYLNDPYFSLYKESIYVGYRYYDTFNIPVLFPFGYGLSYSKTKISDVLLTKEDKKYIVSAKVRNESNLFCKEVIQVYVGQINPTIFKAKKELKDFIKIDLKPNEVKTISFEIDELDLRYYSNTYHKYLLESGTYRFYVAKNVSDESHYADINVLGDDIKEDLRNTLLNYYVMKDEISNSEFEKLINHSLNLNRSRKPYTCESTIKELSKNPIGWLIFKIAQNQLTKGLNPFEKKMYNLSIPYQPIRSIQMVAPLSKTFIDGVVTAFNGHLIKGIKMMKQK